MQSRANANVPHMDGGGMCREGGNTNNNTKLLHGRNVAGIINRFLVSRHFVRPS